MNGIANRVIFKEIEDAAKQLQSIAYGFAKTEFGEVFLGFTEQSNAVCLLHFVGKDNNVEYLKKLWPQSILVENAKLAQQMAELIFNNHENQTIEVVTGGTPFQRLVWETLLKIPIGDQRTYGEVADMIKKPSAVRAVANAVAANEISVLIPCHRVIAKNGNKFKYRWGGEIKRKLLEHEGIIFKV